MSYSPTTWTNLSGEPLNAANLNNMEAGIAKAQTFIGRSTVATMKADTALAAGDLVATQGYASSGDGGQAFYLIQSVASFGGTPDERGDHTLSNGLIAALQYVGTISVRQFGAKGDGVTNDTLAIEAAMDYVSARGGGDCFVPQGLYLCSDGLDVNQNVNLIGAKRYIDFTDRDYWSLASSRIALPSTKSILIRNGGGLEGLVIYRSDMTFPAAGLTATEVALYAGTAVTIMSAAATIRNCAIMGFALGIDTATTNTPRGRIMNVNIDCTSGVRVDQDLGGFTLLNVFVHPFLTNSDADNIRTGIGFEFKNRSDWTHVINCFAFNDTGYKVTSCNQMFFIGAQSDHPTDGTDTYKIGTGFIVQGTSVDNHFMGCQAAAHANGYTQNVSDGNANYISDCHFIGHASTGVGVGVTGGDLFVRGGRISEATNGLLVNNANSNVSVDGTHFVNLVTGISRALANSVHVSPSCYFESISGSVYGGEVLPQVASASSITLPNNAPVVEVTGTTTISLISGLNRLPGERVVLLFPSAITVNHGNTLLAGSVNQAFTAGSLLELMYLTGNSWKEVSRMIA